MAYTVNEHKRLTPLEYGGTIEINRIPSKTLVICFSRKAVYDMAKRMANHGHKVGVLYGALPPEARIFQIDKFNAGVYEVLVTTDVIGHGVNLPADNVVFAQTEKFDGYITRALQIWEVAQIAGRAGRYGLADAGYVYTLSNEFGFNPDARLVENGVKAAAGLMSDGLVLAKGKLRPTYSNLGKPDAHALAIALIEWHVEAIKALKNQNGITPISITPLITRWQLIGKRIKISVITPNYTTPWGLSGEDVWDLLTLPIDNDSVILTALINDLLTNSTAAVELELKQAYNEATSTLALAEKAAAIAKDALTVTNIYTEKYGYIFEHASVIEDTAVKRIIELLE